MRLICMPITPLNWAIWFLFVLGFICLFFFALIFSSRDFFFVSSGGGGCCDEDNKLPLLKALRTLAGRIEPINLLPPLSNCRPLHFLFSFAIPRFYFGLRIFFWKLDSEDQLTHNPTLDPRPACAVRMMHKHLCIWIHQIFFFHFYLICFLCLCIIWWNLETILGHLLTQCYYPVLWVRRQFLSDGTTICPFYWHLDFFGSLF